MGHTSGKQFVSKSQKRLFAQHGDIYTNTPLPPANSIYLPEHEISREKVATDHKHLEAILHPQSTPVTPVLKHVLTRKEATKYMLMRTLGNFLVLLSLYGVVATFGPALYYEAQYQVIKVRGIQYKTLSSSTGKFSEVHKNAGETAPGFGDIIAGAKEQVLVPPDTRFSIIIPKLGATAHVWPNVDPLDEKDFLPKLQTGVAHAKGSVFPGMEGNVYLFAHSTDNFWDVGRYNAVFYLLKDLKAGDDISVYFENRKYNYKVDHTVVKDPQDVDFLLHSQVPGKQQLILQTCWPPGTTWKRLFVVATPQSS